MKGKVGAVLVVGGGIGGIQASLDLSQSGYKVYLLDAKPNIGGVMSMLDKTFPTNDCSTCILSPKLVDVAKNPNIEILANCEVLDVSGEPGKFKVKVLKKTRKVDPEKCTGCGLCQENCPLEVESDFNMGLTQRKAIYLNFPQAVPKTHTIQREEAPCTLRCPLHLNVRDYVGLIAVGRFEDALKLIKEKLPFPSVCGRVCTHPCEEACLRGRYVDEPIAIRELKRFVADYEASSGKEVEPPERKPSTGKRVAIIGAGPSGLTCGYFLSLNGHQVTVYEALDVPGGMLVAGIPPYRLPRDVLAREIQWIERSGVEIKCGIALGRDLTVGELLNGDFDAVFLAFGAHEDIKLGIKGEDAQGVISGVEFLRDANLGKPMDVRGKVVSIIGGGNVAVDVARTSLRLGAKDVHVFYRRTRKEMPASPEEIEDAMEEGVRFHFLSAPREFVVEEGRLKAVVFQRMGLGEPDASGRRRPFPLPDSEFLFETDIAVRAIGQRPSKIEGLEKEGIAFDKAGRVLVDPVTCETSVRGVFAGGDLVTGPSTVIEAISWGKRAAESIDRFLKGEDLKKGREGKLPDPVDYVREGVETKYRIRSKKLDPEERRRSFVEVERGLTEEEAVEEAGRCLSCRRCLGCGICSEVCEAKAIDYTLENEVVEIDVGAIVLAMGFEPFDAKMKSEYGYGRFENVVTSLEFERMLSATGPFNSVVMRPSDGEIPKKIAFIQCVGSRDRFNEYCSAVCCMYATKEAVIAKEHVNIIEPTVFYMDLRSYGKGFDEYCERAKKDHGVRFIRSMPSEVVEDPVTKDLIITYTDENGELVREVFNMVVLSVGLRPSEKGVELCEKLGVELHPSGFVKTSPFDPIRTNKDGVFVCGAFQGPKDIPETVSQASAAAAAAGALLSEVRGSEVEVKELPPERDVSEEPPRIGVFVCHCGVNIGAVVDVKSVVEFAKTLPGVVYAEDNLFTCSKDTQERIVQIIKDHGINRVVVASCTPRTHESLFRDTIREAGLNRYLFEMANIRDQCSWVHMHEPEKATEKAKLLVRAAVEAASKLVPLKELPVQVVKRALVVGGGVSGMVASLVLAENGVDVFLVEREGELGGNVRRVKKTIDGMDVESYLKELISKVEGNPRIQVFTDTVITDFSGTKGNFRVELLYGGMETKTVDCGAIVIATGGRELKPDIYLYGEDERVVTQLELEELLHSDPSKVRSLKTVCMIQCVGSRNEDRPYCSRVCCQEAIKNALEIKRVNPETSIYIVYRDIRTYGLYESFYKKARSSGVKFIRYTPDKPPSVKLDNGRLSLEVFDHTLLETLVIENLDLLVLSSAIVPNENEELANMMKLQRTREGFFLEAHMKLRPVDFATDGIFLCGLAHSPMNIPEAISQAYAAASRAMTVLSKDVFYAGGVVATVDPEKCAVCLTCVRVCPNGVPKINYDIHAAEIDPSLCRGCGICASECPAKAITLQGFSDELIGEKIKGLLLEGSYGV